MEKLSGNGTNRRIEFDVKQWAFIMVVKKIFGIASILFCLVALSFSVYVYCHIARKMTRVHTLKFPMLLGGPEGSGPFQFLPKGTNLYYDQSYPEGFTRYMIYVNVDRYPLDLSEQSDPWAIDPLSAYKMDKDDLKRVMDRNPITKEDLTAILKSKQLSKQEIRELLEEYSK